MNTENFNPGTVVIYGLHGKCQILEIVKKSIGTESIQFYKLEVIKPTASRAQKNDPAIWLPIKNAAEKGLRKPISEVEIEHIWQIISSQEIYFDPSTHWKKLQPMMENAIKTEGMIGLAKAASALFVIKSRKHVLAPEIARFYDLVYKNFYRELSEATLKSQVLLEQEIAKKMQSKLKIDQ